MPSLQDAISHRATRGDAEESLSNLQCNVSRAARLMHKCIPQFRQQEDILEEAIRNYVIALVGALETFYRDLFIFLYRGKPELVSQVLKRFRKKASPSTTHALLTPAEVATTIISFQRLDSIDRALTPLLNSSSYFKTISKFSAVFAVPSRGPDLGRIRLPDTWRKEIGQLLSDRHRYVHDRNSRCETPPKFMAQVETTLLILANLTTLLFARRLNPSSIPENGVPVFLVIEDLISEDWIAEPPEGAA